MRADPAVAAYLKRLDPPVQATARALRGLVHEAAPQARETIAYRIPFYYAGDVPVCYLSAAKAHVGLGFPSGARVRDPSGRLAGSGRSEVRRADFSGASEIPSALVLDWIRRAWDIAQGV